MVVFTALDAAALAPGAAPVLGVADASRHTVLLAAVGDPGLEEMLAGPGRRRGGCTGPLRPSRPAAERPDHGRAAAGGVEVVDASPECFAPAVADAYLALKAAGRL